MAIKNANYSVYNGTTWDTINFTTTASNVKTAGGSNVEADLVKKADKDSVTKYINFGETQTNTHAITESGVYRCSNWTNYPSENPDSQGTLVVYPFNGGWYSIVFISPHTGNMYKDTCVNSVWSGWKRILTKDDYDTLFQYANDGKTEWANIIGWGYTTAYTWEQMRSQTQWCKDKLASYLVGKGVSAVSSEELSPLVDKVQNIVTGKKYKSGSATIDSNGYITVGGLGFRPRKIFANHNDIYVLYPKVTVRYNIDSMSSIGTGGGVSINDDGFSMQIATAAYAGQTVTWEAYE